MTRANINFVYQNVGEMPRTLFFYWNGDQYPTGIRDHYQALDLVQDEITPESFRAWAEKNYDKVNVLDLGEGGQPKVYYTDGMITDYSYVFEADSVKVWEWDKSIFSGSRAEFALWLAKQV